MSSIFVVAFTYRYVPPNAIATTHYFKNVVVDQADPGIQPHFIGRHTPLRYSLLRELRHNNDAVDPTVFVPETNPHFIGKYKGTVYLRFNFNNWDTGVPQAETNPHFIGRYAGPIYRRFNFNNWDTSVPQVETNPHFVGKYVAARHSIASILRHNVDALSPSAFTPETNPHFVGRYIGSKHSILRGLTGNPAMDYISPTPIQIDVSYPLFYNSGPYLWKGRMN